MAAEAGWIERHREALVQEFGGVSSPGMAVNRRRSSAGHQHQHLGCCTGESSEDADAVRAEQSEGDVELAEVEVELAEEEDINSLYYLTSANGRMEDRVHRQGAWSEAESKVLYDAKKKEKEFLCGLNKKSMSADEKWKAIAEFCWSHGVQRSKEQCKFKWENSLPEYRRVKAFEKERPPGTPSYFEMQKKEKRARRLPRNLNWELYCVLRSVIEGEESNGASVGGGETAVGKPNGGDGIPQKSENAEKAQGGVEVQASKRLRTETQQLRKDCFRESKALAVSEAHKGFVKAERSHTFGDGFCNDSSRMNLNSWKNDSATKEADDKADQNTVKGRSCEILFKLEDRKDARHKEFVAVEKERLEVISTIASALNNVALAMKKVAELFQQQQD